MSRSVMGAPFAMSVIMSDMAFTDWLQRDPNWRTESLATIQGLYDAWIASHLHAKASITTLDLSYAKPVELVRQLLTAIEGEDWTREGLSDTPERVVKAWKHYTSGYGVDVAALLKQFQDGAELCGDEMVVVHNIPVHSKCEHHLADIEGWAHVGYIPNGKVVGLSKLARVVDAFSRRLQVQERLTNQIADAVDRGLQPKGVGVVILASHACMSTRGVGIQGSLTSTSAVRGALLDKPEARAEFLDLCARAEARR